MGFLRRLAKTAGRSIARSRGRGSRILHKLATDYINAYNNLDYDLESNGESRVLDRLARHDIRTVFDVGANAGVYTRACLARFKDAGIHAFEIAPATFANLTRNVLSSRVTFNNIGLSNSEGSIELNYSQDDDGKSSLISGGDVINRTSFMSVTASVTTGDRYCEAHGIKAIDLLKIDVEGAEHLVLEGFSNGFDRCIISAVQFEFGMINIYSKFLLKDFWQLFTGYGFVLGPIMPMGVEFKDYHPRDENFQGPPNFLAVHRSRPTLIDAVRLA